MHPNELSETADCAASPSANDDAPVVRWVASRVGPRWRVAALIVLGIVVFWPALSAPFTLDDDVHAAMAHGTFPAPRAPTDLYNFVDDDSRSVLLERGLLPWWTHPTLTVHFFRPLASLLRVADYAVLGPSSALHHLHSLLWWLAAVFGAGALFRHVLAARAAAIATIVFALTPAHATPLLWLANREALVSLALGLPGLLAYLRWRETRRFRRGLLAAALLSGALAAGEYSLALLGYLVAFEVTRRGDSVWRRLSGMLPFVLPTVVYLAARAALGCGAAGSGVYIDPFRDLAGFLAAAPVRFVTLLLEGWFGLARSGGWTWGLGLAALLGVAVVVMTVRATLRGAPSATRDVVCWLILGSTLSVAPMLAAPPTSRLLGVMMLGVAPVVGVVLQRAWFSAGPSTTFHGLAALALGFVHLVHAPVSAWLEARALRSVSIMATRHSGSLRARLGEVATAEVVVVRGNGQVPYHLPFAIDADGNVPPATYTVLSHTAHALVLRRGPRTLELIAARDDALVPVGEASVFSDDSRDYAVGQVFSLPHARATVLALAHGRPRIVSFEFDHDLDHSPLLWVTEAREGFVDARPPPIGRGVAHDL